MRRGKYIQSDGLSISKSPRVTGLAKSFCTRLILISSLSLIGTGMAWASADGDAADAVNVACSSSTLSGTVYVKGGAPAGGNGTKNSPFNKLASVQAPNPSNWKRLVIIPATSATTTLVGSITLKNCQNILGLGANPVKSATNAIVATIKGPTTGDVIILTGNHKIKNLKIQDADRMAISLGTDTNNTAQNTGIANVSLKKVLVVNANKGDYTNLIVDHGPKLSFGQVAGLSYKSGILDVIGSRIEGGKNNGIYFAPAGSSVRTLNVKHTTFKNIINSVADPGNSAGIETSSNGILTASANTARLFVNVDNGVFDNIPIDGVRMIAMQSAGYDSGTKDSASVKHSSFNNLFHPFIGFPHGLTLQTYDFVDNDVSNAKGAVFVFRGGPNLATDTVMTVDNNSFVNHVGTDAVVVGAHFDGDFIGSFIFNVSKNTFENVALAQAAIQSQLSLDSRIRENKITNFNTAYDDAAIVSLLSSSKTLLEKNCLVNGNNGITSFNLGLLFGIPPSAAHYVIDAGGGPLGSVGLNSFVGVATDIQQDVGGEISAKRNYFGGAPVVAIGGEGFVDTSNALSSNPCANAGCGNDGHHRDGQTHGDPSNWDFNDDDGGWNENSDS